jgi:hypothetical protein
MTMFLRATPLAMAALAAAPSVASTQQSVQTLSPYLSTGGLGAGDPVLVGASLSAEAGLLGIRFSAGLDAEGTPLAGVLGLPRSERVRFWGADADALLYLAPRPAAMDLVPYALVGTGVRSVLGGDGPGPMLSWSYGGGARMRVTDALDLQAESRYREPIMERGGGDWSRPYPFRYFPRCAVR